MNDQPDNSIPLHSGKSARRGFASDNHAGVHPRILEEIQSVNHGHAMAYGGDPHTEQTVNQFKEIFGDRTDVYFVFNGTAANVLGLQALTRSYHSVICADLAHLNVDECGAPEKFTGSKLLPVHAPDGKLTVDGIRQHLHGFGFEHHAQPKAVSITQATEMGTVYTPEEIAALAECAHDHGLYLHMDGSRLANAAAGLGCSLREITVDAGVDVLAFGGTKNGMMFGEAVLFFDPSLSADFKYIRKQAMQLGAKMRFIAAQFSALLENDLYLENARHANCMARYLEQKIKDIRQIQITQPVQANGVFAIVPKAIIPPLQEKFFFHVWNEQTSEVRWMTSFDTSEQDVGRLVEEIASLIAQSNV